MGWSGGTYTRARDFTDDETNGIKMLSANFDEEHDEIETGLNNCLTKDGQNSPSADLPMSTQKHTGVGDAAARDQYASFGQVQDGKAKFGTSGGSADTYTLALTPSLTAYSDGQTFIVKFHATCTGASTLNVDGLGAIDIQKNLSALSAGDITLNRTYQVVYFSSLFHLFSQVPAESDPQFKVVKKYYTSNDTWTCPTGVTKAQVQCWGGGGGGGTSYAGQGGAYAESYRTVTPSSGYSITIGSAGSSGGGTGGDSIFGSNAVVAKGGAGNGGVVQSGCVGDFKVYGQTGVNYTKDMGSSVEGYYGGMAYMGAGPLNLTSAGQAPACGGPSKQLPTQSDYAGGAGMIILTYIELV